MHRDVHVYDILVAGIVAGVLVYVLSFVVPEPTGWWGAGAGVVALVGGLVAARLTARYRRRREQVRL